MDSVEEQNLCTINSIVKSEIKIEACDDYCDEADYIDVNNDCLHNLSKDQNQCNTTGNLDEVAVTKRAMRKCVVGRLRIPKIYICETCSKTFKTAKQLRIHVRVHTNERPYKCTECEKAFKQIGALRDHQVTHSGEKKFMCQVCLGYFTTSSSLKRHMRRVHDREKSFTCILCSEIFLNKNAYHEHKEFHFKEILNSSSRELRIQVRDKDGYKCPICCKVFGRFVGLFMHLDIHSTIRYPCRYCKEDFTYLRLKLHLKKKHPYQICSMCGKEFHDKKLFTEHENSHFKVNSKICDYCGVNIETELLLQTHMLSQHTKCDSVFRCTLCLKVYNSYKHLQRHSDFAHIKCKTCSKDFVDADAMLLHCQKSHWFYGFRCKHCTAGFKSKRRLCLHMNLVHLIMGMFPCKVCRKKFLRFRNLNTHLVTHSLETDSKNVTMNVINEPMSNN